MSYMLQGFSLYNIRMNSKQQYILARDMIDMIRDYEKDANVLEYVDGFCFSIARILGGKSVVEWDELADICDQGYSSLKAGGSVSFDRARLDRMYVKYENMINKPDAN